ncbi:MAG TPA: hypothetical protein VEA69_19430 [Tepidisphaeraceae bacterium]|nr:hypothetical protein [Tepidisphaeraceae bacterium]
MTTTPLQPVRPARGGRGGRRPGTVYVVVLGLAALVATIAIGAVATVRTRNRAANLEDAVGDARAYAWSAVELGRLEIANNPSWRSQYRNAANGLWFANRALDRGTIALTVVNPSGALDRADTDPVVVTGTGVRGPARQMARVTLNPVTTDVTCLDSAAFAVGGVSLGSATINGAGLVSSNGAITATNTKMWLNAEAAGLVTGITYNGTMKSLAGARTYPSASSVFGHYVANGTAIPYTSFPAITTGRGINGTVLSPTNNPFGGGTNASGIYVVDCGGQSFIVKSARIVGTLVLLNAGPDTAVQTSVNWAPAVANYPCLLVQGPLELAFNATELSEGTVKVNLNPAGTPYPWGSGGTTDADTSGKYPSTIDGLVYASGAVNTSGAPSVDQLITGGTLSTVGTLTLNYVNTYQASPPPGFYTVTMTVAPGSWRPYSD